MARGPASVLRLPSAGPLLAALLGSCLILYATRWGAGLSPDSTAYVAGARNLLAGHGYVRIDAAGTAVPITRYPPLYSLLLAGAGIAGIDPLGAARPLGAALFGLNILLAARCAARAAGGSRLAGVLAALFVLSSRDLVLVHAMAWSEPLFLALTLLGLGILEKHLDSPSRGRFVAGGVCLALALLTRYAGVSGILAGSAGILLLSREPLARRVRETALLVAIGVLPLLLWTVRNGSPFGESSDPEPGLRGISAETARVAAATASGWIWPVEPAIGAGLLILALFVGYQVARVVASALARRRPAEGLGGKSGDAPASLLPLFALSYLATIVGSAAGASAHIPFDQRILSPLALACLLTVAVIAGRSSSREEGPGRLLRVGTLVAALALVVAMGTRTAGWAERSRRDGNGYASPRFRGGNELVTRIRRLPAGTPIYTNAPDAIYILADRPATRVPNKMNPNTRAPNPRYQEQLEQIGAILGEQGGAVVFLSAVTWRWYLPTEDEIAAALSLPPPERFPEGSIRVVP